MRAREGGREKDKMVHTGIMLEGLMLNPSTSKCQAGNTPNELNDEEYSCHSQYHRLAMRACMHSVGRVRVEPFHFNVM